MFHLDHLPAARSVVSLRRAEGDLVLATNFANMTQANRAHDADPEETARSAGRQFDETAQIRLTAFFTDDE
jgi:hypothetical protein